MAGTRSGGHGTLPASFSCQISSRTSSTSGKHLVRHAALLEFLPGGGKALVKGAVCGGCGHGCPWVDARIHVTLILPLPTPTSREQGGPLRRGLTPDCSIRHKPYVAPPRSRLSCAVATRMTWASLVSCPTPRDCSS